MTTTKCPFCDNEFEGEMCRCGAYKVNEDNYDTPLKKINKKPAYTFPI